MVDPKKAGAKSASKTPAPKSAAASTKLKEKSVTTTRHRDASISDGPKAALSVVSAHPTPAAKAPVAPMAAPVEIIATVVAPKAVALGRALSESARASATGMLAINDKVIDALQSQSNAALDLWRSSLSAPNLSDAFKLQSSSARQAYETASAQWKDIAETMAHWVRRSVETLSSTVSDHKR